MDFDAPWHPISIFGDMAYSKDPAQFDFDEFMKYDEVDISPEEALPTVEKNYFDSGFTTSHDPFTIIEESFDDVQNTSITYEDFQFQFPLPPSGNSNAQLFNSGYVVADAMDYRSAPPSMTPAHSRRSSHASFMEACLRDSPSPVTQLEPVTPITSPQMPLLGDRPLLPRVRPQDQVVHTTTPKGKSLPVNKRFSAPSGISRRAQRPETSHARSVSYDQLSAYLIGNDPIAPERAIKRPRPASTYSSPVARVKSEHARRHSSCFNADASMEYTYAASPQCAPNALDMSGPAAVLSFIKTEPKSMSKTELLHGHQDHAKPAQAASEHKQVHLVPIQQASPSQTLASCLTSRNPCPSLCSEIDRYQRVDKSAQWWWWDIRQVRPWTDFNLETILSSSEIKSFLSSPTPPTFPHPPATATHHPKSLHDLKMHLSNYILPRINAILSTFAPTTGMSMKTHTSPTQPDFTSHSAHSSTPTMVGIVRTWTHWNSGMISEREVSRISYLRGLAELHGKMREACTRYGFIMNETEIMFVRNGCEDVPDFGFVEVTVVAYSAFEDIQLSSNVNTVEALPGKMTLLLALFYLHTLTTSSSVVPAKTQIGTPLDLTRRKVLVNPITKEDVPKDDWIPEIKAVMDSRPAKNSRGWVWPSDALSSKEKKGSRGVKWGNYRNGRAGDGA